jgi:hypothetical protein
MMHIDGTLAPADLLPAVRRLFELAGPKILALDARWNAADGAPVFTARGRYTARGWTEWTQGFQFGAAILAYDAMGETRLLDLARQRTRERMAAHITHMGVHDHGFNNVSTYGNLRRLMLEGRFSGSAWERHFYELALKSSGAVQAARWSAPGYIYSFNGPHSLFIDTLRTLRVLAVAHQLGQPLMGEGDRKISLLHRLVAHGLASARYNVYYGTGRDAYDTPDQRGRTCHEALFNPNDGQFRCPSSQQGYSPFTTWTRGLAWAILGFAEQLEFLTTLPASDFEGAPASREEAIAAFGKAASATADFYIQNACSDGLCYWDTGAPGLVYIADYAARAADPFNDHEPVDSSAAAIAAQGLLRLGSYLGERGRDYRQAGLSVARSLLAEPYLSTDPHHEGLLLHSVYHRPNGWDYLPEHRKIPCGESSMWGDYHLLEVSQLIARMAQGRWFTFFDHTGPAAVSEEPSR